MQQYIIGLDQKGCRKIFIKYGNFKDIVVEDSCKKYNIFTVTMKKMVGAVLNKPSVSGAVLQAPLSLTYLLNELAILFLPILKTS